MRANDDRADELGQQNFFGFTHKRRAETSKFHKRWMVLRGLDLYWYRDVDDDSQPLIVNVNSNGRSILETQVSFDNIKEPDFPIN